MILMTHHSSQRFQFKFKWPDLTINCSEWAISLQVGFGGWGDTLETVLEQKAYSSFIEAKYVIFFLSHSLTFLRVAVDLMTKEFDKLYQYFYQPEKLSLEGNGGA